jgi:xanthine dehydrogenase YagS FAD-binding subunit
MPAPVRHAEPTLAASVALLRNAATMPVGAGIDLMETIAEGLAAPSALVDVRAVPEMLGIQARDDGALRIGGSTTLAQVAAHPDVRERYAVLAAACEQAGPAGALEGTIAGNLCQRPRCIYFRGNVACFKNGGSSCPALEGDNRHLAILEGGPCYIVHPSDVGGALVALDAVLEVAGPGGTRDVAASDFFVLPAERLDRENVLALDELLAGVRLPAESAGGSQLYRRIVADEPMQFSEVSVAATRRADGEVRLVLGGVSPRPYRVRSSIEEETMTGGLDDDSVESLADRALLDAEPLSQNAHKLELASSLLRDAISSLSRI